MRIIIFIIALTISQLLNAQLNLVDIKAVERCTGNPNIYQVEILIKANENSVETYLAEQNYRLKFNSAALKNVRIVEEGASFSGLIPNGNPPTFYAEHNLEGTIESIEEEVASIMSYNIVLQVGTGTLLSENEWSLVGVIEFDVADQTLSKEVTWLGILPDDFPPTFISNNLNEVRTKMQTNFYPTEKAGDNTALVSAFKRTWQHPCSANDGWLKLTWSNVVDEDNEIFISTDGGVNYNSVSNSSGQFSETDLDVGDYDIRIKLSENDCPVILDDVNLVNFGFDPSVESGYNCVESSGYITVNWTPNPYKKSLKISINGGRDYRSVNNNLKTYTFSNLLSGTYNVIVADKSGSCVSDFGNLELTAEEGVPTVKREWTHTQCGKSNGDIKLSWTNTTIFDQIQISIDGGNTYSTIPGAQEYFSVGDLTVGDYDIRMKWGSGENACAIQLDDVNLINKAPSNTGLEAAINNGCENIQIKLVDNENAEATERQFYYRLYNGVDWTNWVEGDKSENNFLEVFASLEGITEIEYRLNVFCDGVISMWSLPKRTALPECRLGNSLNTLPVEVVPNPFYNKFQINITNNAVEVQRAKIELTNLIGKTIYTKQVDLYKGENNFTIEPGSSISTGIYLANIVLDDGTKQTIKLLKE